MSLARVLADDGAAMRLARAFRAAGRELYLVGGPVRDAFLGRPSPDLDFATDAEPAETLDLLKPFADSVWLQGMKYGTVGAIVEGVDFEITTFRTEKYQPSSRHPEVEFAADIQTDLSRRDFTVNSMAVRLPEKTAVDPFDGLGDLKARLLRTPVVPDDSFLDDPLRMLRAFRFASQLGFRISDDALRAIERNREALGSISPERIQVELSKLLVGQEPARALELADATGITEFFLPELSALKLEQDPVHRHKDVFHHTLAVLERTDPIVELRLAALLHDIGKPKTRRIGAEGVTFHHHEVVGSEMAAQRLRALRYPNEVVDRVQKAIYLHHRFHGYDDDHWTDSAVRRYVTDAGPELPLLNALVRADCTTRDRRKAEMLRQRMDAFEQRIGELAAREELENMRPALDGHQVMAFLGVDPGPLVGEASAFLKEIRIDEGEISSDEAFGRLDAWARERGIEPAGRRVAPKPRKKKDE